MSWFGRRWVPRYQHDAIVLANRRIQEERDEYRNRQDGHETLCRFMDLLGIVDIQQICNKDKHIQFVLTFFDGHVEIVGNYDRPISRWAKVVNG